MIKEKHRPLLVSIGKNLTRIREEKGFTPKDLSKLSGIGSATIRRIEIGQTNFRLTTIFTLARALETATREIFKE